MNDKNILTTKEVAELFGLPLVTIERWEHQGKIPFKIIKNKKCYKKKDILEWGESHDFVIKSVRNSKLPISKNLLSQAIELGGIHHNIEGNDIYSVFENSLDIFTFITRIKKDKILDELLNREESASTGIGKGIAIPHSRDRLKIGMHDTYVPVIFLKNAIEYNSVDRMPVQVLFMIFTANTTSHLQILSKISYCLKNSELLSAIENRNKDNNLLELITNIENAL
jgi:PTS system nitrogen regulatory IIA component